MEHRRVKIHDHTYQWVDDEIWEARVVGGTALGRLFDSFNEALEWVQEKPHFILVKIECVKAYKIRSEVVADGDVGRAPSAGKENPEEP